MIREIKKKMVILGNRMPFSPEIKSYFKQVEKNDWLYNNMRLEGSLLAREQIEAMGAGEFFLNVPVTEHVTVQNLNLLLSKLWEFEAMGRKLDLNMAAALHRIICGGEARDYRKRNVIIQEWEYTAPMPAAIPEMMDELAKIFIQAERAASFSEEAFEWAAKIHNKALEIYPYGEGNKILARTLAAYYLITKGCPAIVPAMKEQEYNQEVISYLTSGSCDGVKEALKKEIFNRFDLMIQLTAY